MERHRTPRRRPEAPSAPTTLTEITRRYYATAIALSKAMGPPLTETFMREHRESISYCFIEAGRAGVRLPPAVQLPPLAPPAAATNGQAPALESTGAEGQRPQAGASPTEDAALSQQESPPKQSSPQHPGSSSFLVMMRRSVGSRGIIRDYDS
jgi:hypothetical protein